MNKQSRFLLFSLLSLTTYFLPVLSVKADTRNMPFYAYIDTKCELRNLTNGTLGLGADGKTLDSKLIGGSAGSADLFCNKAGGTFRVRIDSPVASTADASSVVSTSYYGELIVKDKNGNPSVPYIVNSSQPTVTTPNLAPGQYAEGSIVVNMGVTSATTLNAGSYGYSVSLTIISN